MPHASGKMHSIWSSAVEHRGRLHGLIALVHVVACVLRDVQNVCEDGVIPTFAEIGLAKLVISGQPGCDAYQEAQFDSCSCVNCAL
jgi:hypothetical protein